MSPWTVIYAREWNCLATVLSTKSMDRVRTDDFWPEMHSSDPSEVRVR